MFGKAGPWNLAPQLPLEALRRYPGHLGRGWPQGVRVGVQDDGLSQATAANQMLWKQQEADKQTEPWGGRKFKAPPCHTR